MNIKSLREILYFKDYMDGGSQSMRAISDVGEEFEVWIDASINSTAKEALYLGPLANKKMLDIDQIKLLRRALENYAKEQPSKSRDISEFSLKIKE